jgi:hypothetical protein|tara:strand:+ start:7401 stop:7655 length:255 start_codon:yes stop_codon:yes gene_type:complete
MKLLATFLLVGTVDSKDDFFATVELNSNPPQEQAAIAVIPITAFPCKIEEGDTFYILKSTETGPTVIICAPTGLEKPISDDEGC